VYVEKNILTQDMLYKGEVGSRVPNTYTIFVIKYDFVLGGNITIPANCILEFDGGSISGAYTITGNNTGINAGLVKIFNTNVTLAGTFKNGEWDAEWFGTDVSVLNNDTFINFAVEQLHNIGGGTLRINNDYVVSDTIFIREGISLVGTGNKYRTSTYYVQGFTSIKCAFANKNKWMLSIKVDNTIDYSDLNLDGNQSTLDKLDGISIENLSFRPVNADGSEILNHTSEAIFGGIRLAMFNNSVLRNIVVYGAKYGLAISRSWCSTINNVYSFATSCGIYFGSTNTTLSLTNCRFRNGSNNFTGGTNTISSDYVGSFTIPYLNDISNIGAFCSSSATPNSINFDACTFEGWDVAVYAHLGYYRLSHFYVEAIQKTLLYSRVAKVLIENQAYGNFNNIPIVENGYEIGGYQAYITVKGSISCLRCYPDDSTRYVVDTDGKDQVFYDKIESDGQGGYTLTKSPTKIINGIGKDLYIAKTNNSSKPLSSEANITLNNELSLGLNPNKPASSLQLYERVMNLFYKDVVVHADANNFYYEVSKVIENRHLTFEIGGSDLYYINNNFLIKNSDLIFKADTSIRTNGGDATFFDIYEKASIEFYNWYNPSNTWMVKLMGNKPVNVDIFIRKSDFNYTAYDSQFIKNPDFACPYHVNLYVGGVKVKEFTNTSRPTASIPTGYVYIENGHPIYYTGSAWVDATDTPV
jgi:hypothetical protein